MSAMFGEKNEQGIQLIRPAQDTITFTPDMAADAMEIIGIVSRFQEEQRLFYRDRLPVLVNSMVRHYRNLATNALTRCGSFRDDMLTWFRAMAVVCDMVGNASTHSEKNARLRGMAEIIEGAIRKLRDQRFEINDSLQNRLFDDVFACDFPTRELLQQIHDLKAENESLKNGPKTEQDAAKIEF